MVHVGLTAIIVCGMVHQRGLLITAAIAFHNIPEGLGVALVLVSKGASASRACMWAILTSLPQPLVAVPSFLFVETFKHFHPCALGFASGSMLCVKQGGKMKAGCGSFS